MTALEPDEWVTIEQAASLANRTPAAIYKWIQRGKLYADRTIDSVYRVRSRDIEAIEQSTPRKGGRPVGSASHNTPRRRT